MQTGQISTKPSAREVLAGEWNENPDELAYISQLTDESCNRLISNVRKADRCRRIFKSTKLIIIVCFIAVYIAFYFKLKLVGMIIQLLVLLLGLSSVISFLKLRKIESNPDYKKLYLLP